MEKPTTSFKKEVQQNQTDFACKKCQSISLYSFSCNKILSDKSLIQAQFLMNGCFKFRNK